MRAILLIAMITLATTVAAEDEPEPKSSIKRIDKSSPVLLQGQDGNDETHTVRPGAKAPATDYNSSRSNSSSVIDSDSDDDSIPTKRCRDGKDNDCNRARPAKPAKPAKPANHNTTRSNRTSG